MARDARPACASAQIAKQLARTMTARVDTAQVSPEAKEKRMSKGQRGNKEAKKPKKAQSGVKPVVPDERLPGVTGLAPGPTKKK
jgi:hypothetical protein